MLVIFMPYRIVASNTVSVVQIVATELFIDFLIDLKLGSYLINKKYFAPTFFI